MITLLFFLSGHSLSPALMGVGGGGGGSSWILASGAWNDSGVWDDDAFWLDS
jgi:hypothetical protein